MSVKPTREELVIKINELEEEVAFYKMDEVVLRESKQEFKNIVESSPMGIHLYKLEQDGRLVFIGANPAADTILGVDNKQFIGKTIEEAFPPLVNTEVPERYRLACSNGESWQIELINYEHDQITGAFEIHAFQTAPNVMATLFLDITERKRAEEKLRESEERYRSLITKMMNGFALHEIICDETGKPENYRFLEVNAAFEEMTGLKADEIIGKTVLEVLPDTEPYWIDIYGKVALSGESIRFENYAQEFDRYFEALAYSPKQGQFAVLFTGITKRKKAEEALRESEERFRILSEASFEGIGIADKGVILDVNEQLVGMLGYNTNELIGLDVMEIVSPESRELVTQYVRSGYQEPYEHLALKKDGSVFPVEVRGQIIPYDGRRARVTAIRDISERVQVEKDKLKFINQLQEAQKFEAIASLAGGIAHQFNNALSAITGFLDLLERRNPNDEPIDNYIQPMKDSSQRMVQLTSQLLAYARGGKYQSRQISLSDFVRETLPLVSHTIKPSIQIETDLHQDIMNVEADSTQLQMVISALLSNAIEAIEDTGRIRISCRNELMADKNVIDIPGILPGSYVCLSMEDNGRGMDKDTKSKIFDPFFSTKFQGRGLGMAAVFGIVKNHDGYAMVDSEVGSGTTVRLYFPAIPIED